ncbi:MAG TPA: MarR family winged helix-turn-helix transcriptional regulator [Burkholderiaceae bacterium]|nr:MarR family winged helix-turn-helix transcriptional regulator [Burkholderiaceae bacterium]
MASTNTLEHRIAFRFSRLVAMNLRCMAGVYAKRFKLTTTLWRIFSIIGRYEPVFPGVVAQYSTMDADKVTRAVDRLVDMKLLIRNTDATDRRRVVLSLSAKGRAVFGEIEAASQSLDARWRGVLTAEEARSFLAAMDKLETQARTLFNSPDVHGARGVRGTGTRAGRQPKAAEPATAPRGGRGTARPAARTKGAARMPERA